ncbi:MAG: hypothetical protein Q8N47_00130 [Bryobacterales bacterium]|nr:hypothetical protein [Bryobacterales bacterium]
MGGQAGNTPPVGKAQTFQCVVNAGVPPNMRAEDLASLASDPVLNCTGGTPTPFGVTIPAVNIQVYFNTNLTSRILYPTGSWAEPLLLIDEPVPANRIPCIDRTGIISGANSVVFLGVPMDPPGGSALGFILPTQAVAYVSASGTTPDLGASGRQIRNAHQEGVDGARGLAAFGDGPDH